jgi:regulator of protease activity HflC (stomatin/prohibitin superfamily)
MLDLSKFFRTEQEVIKAQAVTEAQQQLEVATLAAKAAEQTKREQILLGEGEATRKRLVMQANGALEDKLAVWKEVNLAYANAIEKYTGNWVPTIVMGGDGKNTNGADNLISLLTTKTAKDLALDFKATK